MIGRRTEELLTLAARFAMDRNQEYFTLETVLHCLLQDGTVSEILHECGANTEVILKDLETYLEREVPKMQNPRPDQHPVATHAVQRLIQRALFQVQSSGRGQIEPEDLLVALFQAKDSYALYTLQRQGVDRLSVIQVISHGGLRDGANSENEEEETESEEGSSGRPSKNKEDALAQYATNLNEQAKLDKIDPLIGRSLEIDRVIQTLCRRRKNNPLLVGEAGVGKTAIAEGLALKIVSGQVPELLKSAVVYSLDLGGMLAGAKFRGDFEQRVKKVIDSLMRKKEHGIKPVLFIDEIHTIVGAGAVSGGALDAANLLKPMLTKGEIQVIGSTTYAEYRNVFEKDHALARRFQKIDVNEPSQEDSIQIIQGLKPRFESFHNVEYTNDAIRAAVELSSKHITDRFLPDKAIDIVDEAGARSRLARSGTEKESERAVIDMMNIETLIAQIARIPQRSVSTNQKARLKNLDRDLKLAIFGQDHAIEALATSIRLARSGLRTGDKPVGSFLFCGPTGVGKTELSKQLALCLGVPFLRFDMSEYMEKHAVSRLIGAPPGYVGFEQAGLLTDAVLKSPYSVVLLDEIEKAHPDLLNILLQVMDHGFLTDQNGRKADFRNVIVIMTSNVGSRDLERRSLGLSIGGGANDNKASKAVETYFTPEFRNRLDAIVYFKPLDPSTMSQVVMKALVELESQLLKKNVDVEFSHEIREWLSAKGYDRLMGARPLARLIQDQIKKPLSEEVLFGRLESGGHVVVTVKDDEPHFEYTSPKKPSPATESQPVTTS